MSSAVSLRPDVAPKASTLYERDASGEELALFGGAAAVRKKYRERWRKVRLGDLLRIARLALKDVTTVADGSGLVAEFERKFLELVPARYALTMNSGTATLHSAFFAVGVKPGHEVIVPSYTWFASAAPILQCGGTPVFCDIDERTLTADPDDVERRITPRTRALCVVHVWGNPARMDRFVEIASRHGIALIEDCSHAPGATYQGRPVGTFGDVGCFSLQGEKAISGGELGIAVTSNAELFDRMLILGHNGRSARGQKADSFAIDGISLGLKYRPHLYGVVLAIGGLRRLDELNRRRRHNYQILCDQLVGCPAIRPIETYSDAERGGLLEFIFRYEPQHAGGWNRGAFVKAARAEGVPIGIERFANIGPETRLLHRSPIFTRLDYSKLGGYLGGEQGASRNRICGDARLPVLERIADRLVTMRPLTAVSESFVRDCARAMRKVAAYAAAGNPC